MTAVRWTKALLSERARRHEHARWEAEAEITELERELRALKARLAAAERKAQRRSGLAYRLRALRDEVLA